MDAQNAADSDQTRLAGASPEPRRGLETDSKPKPSSVATAASPRDAQGERTAPSVDHVSASTPRREAAPEDPDSDAETIVLPGKDGHSPSKVRQVRQEDKVDRDGDASKGGKDANGHANGNHDGDKAATSASDVRLGEFARKKRLSVSAGSSADKNCRPRHKDAASSGLSSAPASPPHHLEHHLGRRRRSDVSNSPPSDSETCTHTAASSKTCLRDKLKSGQRLPSHKRRAPKAESDDEGDLRKARPPRTASVGVDVGRHGVSKSAHPKHGNRDGSPSPPPRQHRRSTSIQLHSQVSSSNGLSGKKRRLPPPLHSTGYQSDESSNGDSPHPRTSKLRSLAAPAAADNSSPAKMGPHKKHLDAHGQTLLARACARGEYDTAKQRLHERPEDLNVADYAGNTPLQIASINGCEDIVKLLIDAGCNLDCVNYDKDTPLLDAVDNGHLGVVNLLLDAGVNPRKANVNGEEPIDRVTKDTDNADEIRAALLKAKKRAGERRRTSEDRHSHTDYPDARDSHAPDSPRHSPPAASSSTSRRTGTVRSTKTRNDLLYMPLDEKTLRQAAGRGDEETVARILQVKEGYDDPESMVAAARGGHDLVIQLLLGLGGANADPGPVASLPAEFATPILAAIGQENIKVVELLLEQQGFDPTRRFKGETYYEIARRRQGTNWKEEEQLLKNAYDEYKRSHKDVLKTKSPGGRRERERGSRRDDVAADSKSTKRRLSSPSRELEQLKRKSSKIDRPKDKRRPTSINNNNKGDEESSQKKTLARPKKEVSAVSDTELPPSLSHKPMKARRTESDFAAMSSEGEAAKPRRKLVSKGELRGERDKQKRNPSHKESPSPRENRGDEVSEKARPSERYHDRAKALKRDEPKDRLPSDGSSKRHRTSLTPDRPSDVDKGSHEIPAKRRRLDADSQENRTRFISSEDARQAKSSSSRDGSARPTNPPSQKGRDENSKHDVETNPTVLGVSSGEKSVHVKDEDLDVAMPDLVPAKVKEPQDEVKAKLEAERASKAAEEKAAAAAAAKKEEDDRKRAEAEKVKEQKEEEARRIEAERAKKKAAEEAAAAAAAAAAKKEEEDQWRAEAEKVKKQKEEEMRRIEAEKRKRQQEEEAKKRKEQEERERREAAQREEEEKRKRAEEEKRRREEEERKQREEEERLHREKLQREAAAEEARRQREEEERKERERRERAHREEVERKRAAREAELKRIREDQERARLDKLPPLLRWLDRCPTPKTSAIAEKFKNMLGVRYDTIRPAFTGTSEGREQCLLNTHVALLLGEKDLDLSRYTAWERVPVSHLAKISLWRTEWPRYCLLSQTLWDLGRQLPGCYGDVDPSECNIRTKQQLIKVAWEKFEALDMFFVKLSDFLYTVPNIPHLRNIKLSVEYRELLENEAQIPGWQPTCKWKQDPGVEKYHGFAPRRKYYIHGALVGEEMPSNHQTSKTPFPESRVPRRGLVQAFPEDPDYVRLCMEQGLEHLVNGARTPSLTNGDYSSPTMQNHTTPTKPAMNGENGRAGGARVNGVHASSA